MKVGVTGSRNGMTIAQHDAFKYLMLMREPHEFHHGDCIGVDAQAHKIVNSTLPKTLIIVHPPENGRFRAGKKVGAHRIERPLPYLDRNKSIVDASDLLIVIPNSTKESLRSGTWSTKRYAESIAKDFVVIYPDGVIYDGTN